MIYSVRPYQRYKDPEVPWLAKVPEHWEVRRNRLLFAKRSEIGSAGLPILEVSLKTGVRVRDFNSSNRKQVMSDREKYQRAWSGDLVYNMMRMWQGAVGVAPVDGLVSPAYVVARPFSDTVARYFEYLYRTNEYMGQVNQFSRGIVSDRNRLYWDQFKQMPAVVPPLEEQSAIVRFLDYANRQIRRYIRAKQRLIKLLEEQKQVIVHRAVTRGLDSSVRLKPSGVDWLGGVPEHWDVRRLKYVADISTGSRDTVDHIEDGEHPFFVRSQNVERINSYSFDGEAVLTAGDGAGVAKVFHYANGKFDYHQRVYKFSGFRQVSGKYFFYYFRSTLRFEAFRETAKSTVDSLRLTMLQNFPVPLPPLNEQNEIIRVIEQAVQRIDDYLRGIRHEVYLLREYRTRLISDVVTGKLDVRAAVDLLPDIGPPGADRHESDVAEFPEAVFIDEGLVHDEFDAELEEVEV